MPSCPHDTFVYIHNNFGIQCNWCGKASVPALAGQGRKRKSFLIVMNECSKVPEVHVSPHRGCILR